VIVSGEEEEREEVIVTVTMDACTTWLPKEEDFRTFLMSQECAELAEMAANLV